MMRQYELVERVQKYKPDVNEALLNKAYVYAMQKHGQQKRASGDPYISHPLEVAAILTEMHLDESTIAVALLHDTIEDTTATRQEIDDLFGEDIGALVEGLTKIKKLDLVTKKAKQAENLRKLLLAISDDVRVLLVKLADRLHNMRTLDHMSAEKRARISEETMDIYAPLAGRMGMQDMREELENLSFRHINPEAYETVTRRLQELSERNEGLIKKIEEELSELLQAEGLTDAQVRGRQKKPYSVFRKMQSKSLSFEQLSDVWGFRIIVNDIPSCYRALGIVHTRWRVVPGRFKDYVSTPKQNDYQSIHTTIIGPSRQRIELQIRTKRMHEIAEYGIAAHALYKDRDTVSGDLTRTPTSNAYSWLRRTIESLAEGDNPEEFLEHTKLELFQDQVFCFTPKGQLIALPRGATPIDFAYAVHTNIGDTCVGAKINGRIMPLVTRLNNGDEVEIIRSGIQVPPPAWEEIVVTGKARAAIRRATRAAIRKQYAGLGYRILERTFERAGKTFSREALKPVLHRLGQKDVEDAIAAVGRGELSSLDVLRAVFPDHQDERVTVKPSADDGWFNMRSAAGMIFKLPERSKEMAAAEQAEGPEALPIRGLSGNAEVHFSPAGAVPGDRIVGIMDKEKGITIYPIQSPILQKFDEEPERWIDVRWDLDEANNSRFMARIAVSALNEPGTLAEVAQAIATTDVNIRSLSMGRVAADFSELQFDLEVWDLRQLNHLMAQLKELPSISMVKRLFE
ncbi:bifunctional (p)ppGpp synthetase/guanosine-3',5'-bis(diphosphate) 3'-pyrophosphohydrolase [Sinorhizobium meliloti WSM1022]|jgi:GTP diphosphokinase / guanosine-3',5'-bis(diphosphate) 3'-diphosphatase|uniref:RelA/SpoT family protein n=1 Tax=Rhizobium meliloti TaxID=382 RepID=UPI000286159A|nr:bifunctional (p)ppGpp synthetase/guanosine-3',5'-bis(diphosphate) 3'-pyrophosphohydrolase [Sinorhizobium meliloti]ASP79698.1 bifunctional (p)ppGpp synthetase/guanosine-3',5'-bis(diphosphate) 3'-pyrophosphohydrolase [Sinorhizobium meliloti]ASQ04612.1 bifunctional (p)ppGpp synthetase/guanosine-3',5'-bis(diphosphate) 3'-pyrophosphohydrolase [Sinorhizobium meliloti]KKA15786.1 GTP pyrophosphokinase [Sinorhizobium meliloti]MCO6420737.1 bifunctional (p)ppGpp synthetase/guanosine-3',5'-bis(diphospha